MVSMFTKVLLLFTITILKKVATSRSLQKYLCRSEISSRFGSGIFLSGFNDESGLVEIAELTTGDVYSNGMIPTGQPNLITGGIFIVYGAYVKSIVSNGLVETYGTNDMVLDVWGKVDKWVTKEKVVSYGPSGIGFVNFGSVGFSKLKSC